jgi:hypothetical protein
MDKWQSILQLWSISKFPGHLAVVDGSQETSDRFQGNLFQFLVVYSKISFIFSSLTSSSFEDFCYATPTL